MKPNAVIFDIDGTLADCEHRRHFVTGKNKDWKSFYESMGEDNPKIMVCYLHDYFRRHSQFSGYEILFVTGRPLEYRDLTEEWITLNIYPYRESIHGKFLFMRPDNDYTRDDELKKRIYLEEIEPKYNVRLVLDDRDKVVKMWRSLGLECWQVAEGNF